MKRDGAAVTCDGRLFHGRAAATGNSFNQKSSKQSYQQQSEKAH